MKVLMIAPLPKDVGGTYTTGVGKVALELSNQKFNDWDIFMSSTNISQNKARKICKYKNQYNGYQYLFIDLLYDFLFHPTKTFRELRYYKKKCHVNPLKFEFFKLNIRKHIKRIKPDIIHVHTTECVPASFANVENIPIICTMHGVFYRGLQEQKELGDFLQACVDHSDYFTGLTKKCELYMKKYFGIADNKLTIIPNGVNTSLYYYDENERNKLRDIYHVENAVVFITVASLQKRKGQLKFIKLLEKLNIDFRYWILGEGPDKQVILNYCHENGLEDRIKCFGNIDSKVLYKYYSAADIYAHPSTMEGQALSEMEAYATGIRTIVNEKIKDTIATDITNEDNYYVINLDYPQISLMEKWIQKGNSFRQSRLDLSWDVVAEMYLKYYNYVKLK